MLKTGQGIKEGGKITSLNGEYVLAMKGGLDEGGNIGGTIEFYKNTAVDKDKDPPIKTILGTLIPDKVKTSGYFSNFFHGPYSLIMQRDGNVVYYYNHPYEPSFNITRAGKDYYSLGLTKTDGNRGANLAVTNWGDIIIYGIKKENEILWSLDHNHKDVFFKKDKVEGKKDKVEDEKDEVEEGGGVGA